MDIYLRTSIDKDDHFSSQVSRPVIDLLNQLSIV